jgi:predicted nucleic acid-binding protein
MSASLDTSVLVAFLFLDANTPRAFRWLGGQARRMLVSHWAEAELFAVINRRVRSGLLSSDIAVAAGREFDAIPP